MASTSETGHAKNVANFEDLISFCTGYGATYNPSKAAIQIASLNTLRTNAQGSITGVNSSKTAFTNATNSRQTSFDPLKKLCTKIVNALDATDATDKLVKDAKTINNKIQGKRSGDKTKPPTTPVPPIPPIPTPTPEDKSISVSQQSYDSLIENFDKLITLVSSEPTYTPNETDLQISTLQTLLGNLKATNTAVVNAYTNYSNSRITRNSILYAATSGLVDIAGDVKKYVKSVFGATSPQFKQVSKLEFKKVK
jgi:hypothetical protein